MQGGRPMRTSAGFAGHLSHEFQLSPAFLREQIKIPNSPVPTFSSSRRARSYTSRSSTSPAQAPLALIAISGPDPIRIYTGVEPRIAGITPRAEDEAHDPELQQEAPFLQVPAALRAKWSVAGRLEQCWSLEHWRHRSPRFAVPGQGGDKATAAGTRGLFKPSSPGL